MEERLEKLRFALGLEWGELAQKLGISRAMLGFIRKGDRRPSAKLSLRITELEQTIGSNSVATVATDINWKERALQAEKKLLQLRKAIQSFIRVTENLEGAL